ncbi:MAG: T9SS type A sorting domain-containing protein [Bacteroidota bacterium]|nr:T9SS type A sorting domain-containing protein [Bacteroidota bacterium]
MKKILLFLCCLTGYSCGATTWDINVQNYQFSPSSLNVAVGDVIHWVWVTGVHTTTSVTIPIGASPWDAALDATAKSFNYTVTKPGVYSYECSFHSFLGMTASFTVSGVTPIILSAFNIGALNKMPLISWTTQTEINAAYFSVRKSFNGIDFNEIGKVQAKGNSFLKRNYSFIDKEIPAQITYVYYSIATVDVDEKVALSPIKIYKNLSAAPKLIISLSPNPITAMGHLTIQFNANTKGTMIASLVNSNGQQVLKTELSADVGVNNGHIHLMDIPAGLYILKFTLAGLSETYTIIKN